MSEALILTTLVLLPLLLVRNEMSYRWCMRRSEEISAVSNGLIAVHRFEDVDRVLALYGKSPQIALIFDLRVWTYAQAFPRSVVDEAEVIA